MRNVDEEGGWDTEKIRPQHLERLAVVYVRQSTMQQVLAHQESTRLHYGLVRRAVAWGWPEARVLVIDDELGRSGTSAAGRHGFQRLVAEVGLAHVGLILGGGDGALGALFQRLASPGGDLCPVWEVDCGPRRYLCSESV